jgi:hypothetical protein
LNRGINAALPLRAFIATVLPATTCPRDAYRRGDHR